MADQITANNSLQFYQQCGTLIEQIDKDERELRVVELEIKAIEAENKKLAKEYEHKKKRLSESKREVDFLQMATTNQDQAIQSAWNNIEIIRQQIILKEKEIQAEESKRKDRRAKYERQLLEIEKESTSRISIYKNMPLVKKIKELKNVHQNEQMQLEAQCKEIKQLKDQLKGFERLPYKTINEWATTLAESFITIKSLEKDASGHLESISLANQQLQEIANEEEEIKKQLAKNNLASNIGLKSFFQFTKKTSSELPGSRSFLSKDFGSSGSKVQSKFGSTSNINSSSSMKPSLNALLPKSAPSPSRNMTKSFSLSNLASFLPKSKFFNSTAATTAPKGNIQKCYSTSSISSTPKTEVTKSNPDNQPQAAKPKLSTWLSSSVLNDSTRSNNDAIHHVPTTSSQEKHLLPANAEVMKTDAIPEEREPVESMQTEPSSICGLLLTQECGVDEEHNELVDQAMVDENSSHIPIPKIHPSCDDAEGTMEQTASQQQPPASHDEGVFQKPWTPKKHNTSLSTPPEQDSYLSPIGPSQQENEYFTPPSGDTSVEYDFVEQYKSGLAEIHKTAIHNFVESNDQQAITENMTEMRGNVDVPMTNTGSNTTSQQQVTESTENQVAHKDHHDHRDDGSKAAADMPPATVQEPSSSNLVDNTDVAMDTCAVTNSNYDGHNESIASNPDAGVGCTSPKMTSDDNIADVSVDDGESGGGNMSFFNNMMFNSNEDGADAANTSATSDGEGFNFPKMFGSGGNNTSADAVDAANTSATSDGEGFNFSKMFASACSADDDNDNQEEGGSSINFLQMFGSGGVNDTSADAGDNDESCLGNFNFNFNSNDESIDQGEFKTPKLPVADDDDTSFSTFNFGGGPLSPSVGGGDESNDVPSFFDKNMTGCGDDDDDEGTSGFKFDVQMSDDDDDEQSAATGMSSFAKIFGLGS